MNLELLRNDIDRRVEGDGLFKIIKRKCRISQNISQMMQFHIWYFDQKSCYANMKPFDTICFSLNSRDLFLNLRRLVKMTKRFRFENKSWRLKYKCLICIWIIFWAILDLFINPKYLFQNKSFSQTYYFKSEKSFVISTSLLGLKINPGNLESWYVRIFSFNREDSVCSGVWVEQWTHIQIQRRKQTEWYHLQSGFFS